MKKVLLVAVALAVFAAFRRLSQHQATAAVPAAPEPVEELAHRLQDAWADHHTTA